MAGYFPAQAAEVIARVDIKAQQMRVSIDGVEQAVWPVSTAGAHARTPHGTFHPQWTAKQHRSSIYGDLMPYTVNYDGAYAVHGVDPTKDEERLLGHPASNGCVRISDEHARQFLEWTRANGLKNVTIIIN